MLRDAVSQSIVHRALRLLIALCALVASSVVGAATVWNGPSIQFSKESFADPTLPQNQDHITSNVWITRGTSKGFYNAKTETAYDDLDNDSPHDTEWATGDIADYATLTYQNWRVWALNMPTSTVGKHAVVHLKTDDIYIALTVTVWAESSGGGFTYTRSTAGAVGPGIASAIEYYNAGFDHYFVTSNQNEITQLDNGTFVGWARTGQSFNVDTTATAGASSVCRFFSAAFAPKSSHFYTPFADECATVKMNPDWQFEGDGDQIFYIPIGSATGGCDAGTVPVYRLYNNGMGGAPNHRYTTSAATRDQMVSAGWIVEGNGPGFAFMCSPM